MVVKVESYKVVFAHGKKHSQVRVKYEFRYA